MMTSDKIEKALAEVMGWHKKYWPSGKWAVKKEWWYDKNECPMEEVNKWHPLTNRNQLWMVLLHEKEKGFGFFMGWTPNSQQVRTTLSKSSYRWEGCHYEDTFAIAEAILRAKGKWEK